MSGSDIRLRIARQFSSGLGKFAVSLEAADLLKDPRSPDLGTCLVPDVADCDDTRFAVTPANTTETNGKFMVIWSASADSIYKQGYKYIVSATQIAGTLLGQPAVRALHSMGVKKVAFAYVDEPGLQELLLEIEARLGEV